MFEIALDFCGLAVGLGVPADVDCIGGAIIGRILDSSKLFCTDAIVKHSHGGWFCEVSGRIKPRCIPDDVVAIPVSGFSHVD